MAIKFSSKKITIYLAVWLIILLSIQSCLLSHFIAVLISLILLRKYLNYFSLLALLLAIEFLLEPVPKKVDVVMLCFLLLLLIYFLYPVVLSKGNINRINATALILTSFLYVFFFSYSFFLKQIPLVDVLRGIAPFMLFFIFFPTVFLLKIGRLNFNSLIFALILWGLLYSVNNVTLFILNAVYNYNIYRITILDQNTISAMPLYLAVISLYYFITDKHILFQKNIWIVIHIMAVIGILVTQTRSMILLTLIFYLMAPFVLMASGRLKTLLLYNSFFCILSCLFVILVNFSNSLHELIKNIYNRFKIISHGDHNVLERYDEYLYALKVFYDSPILGGGIGIRFSERHGELVNYIHNSFFYFLANIGMIGFAILLILLLFMTTALIKIKNVTIMGILYGMIAIIIFSFFFSTYKWFFHNMIIGFTFACIIYLMQRNPKNYA